MVRFKKILEFVSAPNSGVIVRLLCAIMCAIAIGYSSMEYKSIVFAQVLVLFQRYGPPLSVSILI